MLNILVNTNGFVVFSADNFSFGAWEEADILNGVVVHKWKAEDETGNLLGYIIDENRNAINGSESPSCQIFDIDGLPADYVSGKYLYINNEFVLNPEWVEPEPTLEERVSELEVYNADLLYQVCLLQLGLTEDDLL